MTVFKNLKVLAPLILSKAMKKDSPQRKRVNQFLLNQMGESKGLWLKMGQLFTTQQDTWEDLVSDRNLTLNDIVTAIPKEDFLPYLKNLLESEGHQFENWIDEIQWPGTPASIAQVHSIELKGKADRSWVIKAKLPAIEEIINDQLKVLGLLKTGQLFTEEKRKFSIEGYQENITNSFKEELDYNKERGNITLAKGLESVFPCSKVPTLHPELQGEDFIVMEKLIGDDWSHVLKNYSDEEKWALGSQMFQEFLYQFFCMGHAQGDFHPGNFLFQKTDLPQFPIKIQWIDWGQVLRPTDIQRLALFKLIDGMINNTDFDENLGPYFKAWDFDLEKLAPIADRLPLLLTKIFQPLTSTMAFDLKGWKLKDEIEAILGGDKWWFRTAGSPTLFITIRCWIGLFSLLESLGQNVFLRPLWNNLKTYMETSLPNKELPKVDFQQVSFNDLAKKLHVHIKKDGVEKVTLEMPARSIETIKDFISKEVLREMERHGINLDQIVTEQMRKGLSPGNIVDFHEGTAHYRVYLS